jgi:hypothetical protein
MHADLTQIYRNRGALTCPARLGTNPKSNGKKMTGRKIIGRKIIGSNRFGE